MVPTSTLVLGVLMRTKACSVAVVVREHSALSP